MPRQWPVAPCHTFLCKKIQRLAFHDTIMSLTPILVKLCIFIYLIWHDKLIYIGVFLFIIHDSIKVAHSPFSSPQMMCRISGFSWDPQLNVEYLCVLGFEPIRSGARSITLSMLRHVITTTSAYSLPRWLFWLWFFESLKNGSHRCRHSSYTTWNYHLLSSLYWYEPLNVCVYKWHIGSVA